MHKYIVYKRFKNKSLKGTMVNLPYGTECEEVKGTIFYQGKALALVKSENAYQYFACNDDGNGLERGKLVQKILSTLRDNEKAWASIWADLSLQKYKRKEHADYWLWNYEFYNADIDVLKYILNIAEGSRCIS